MSDLHRDTPEWLQQLRSKHYDDRFHQLNGLLNTYSSAVWSYLLAVNGGAAAGMLAFIGARSDIAKLQWPYWVLGVFVVGVVLIGFAHAFMVHKAQALIDNWNLNMDRYWRSEITWSHLHVLDNRLVDDRAKVPWILGWTSLLLFFLGVCGAAWGFRSLAFAE